MTRRLVTLAAVVAACGHLLLARQPQQAPGGLEPLPTFRAGVEAVQIDAFVTDEDGRPVTDLTVDDFEVVENGVPRPIVAFSRVESADRGGARTGGAVGRRARSRVERRSRRVAVSIRARRSAATDLRNRAYPGASHSVNLEWPVDAPASGSGKWLRMATQLELPAGQHQIRVSAGGTTRAGSVVYDLEVPDFERGALVLSGVSITADSAATMLTLRPAPGEGSQSAIRCRPPSCALPLATGGAPSG